MNNYRQDDNPFSLVVVDDGEILDFQIVYTLETYNNYQEALLLFVLEANAIDRTAGIEMIWNEKIEIGLV
jgi:hypothetical protein